MVEVNLNKKVSGGEEDSIMMHTQYGVALDHVDS